MKHLHFDLVNDAKAQKSSLRVSTGLSAGYWACTGIQGSPDVNGVVYYPYASYCSTIVGGYTPPSPLPAPITVTTTNKPRRIILK